MPNYQCILIDDPRPAVRRVTLNRPEKRNAFRPETVLELLDAFSRARDDERIGVLITRQAAPDSGPGT